MTARISIGTPNDFLLGSVNVDVQPVINKNILVENEDSSGSIVMKFGSSKSGSQFLVRDSSNVVIHELRSNGKIECYNITGLIDDDASVGTKGDLYFSACNDGDTESAILMSLRYNTINQFHGQLIETKVPPTTLAGDNVRYTFTQILNGYIDRDVQGSFANDRFPTAANLVAGIPNVKVGTTFETTVKNLEARSISTIENVIYILIDGGDGTSYYGGNHSRNILPQTSKTFRIRITNIGNSTETYDIFHVGIHNPIKADGMDLRFRNTGGTQVSLSGTGPENIILLASTAGMNNYTRFPTTFNYSNYAASGTPIAGIVNKGKSVNAELTFTMYAQKSTGGTVMISLQVQNDGVGVGGVVCNNIEDSSSGSLSLNAFDNSMNYDDVISVNIESHSGAVDIDIYYMLLSVKNLTI